MTDVGVWVYAVCIDFDGALLAGARGVDGEQVRLVRTADLAAVVGSVDLATFGEDGLRRSLNDIQELERIARAHHGVVGITAQAGPVAPTRLATVYGDDARVRDVLTAHSEEFRAALDHISGRHEWGVKAFVRDRPVVADSAPTVSTSGSAYLRQRKAALTAKNASRQAAVGAAEAIHVRVARLAVAAREHRPQDPQLAGDNRVMLLNGAYLVDDEAADRFRVTVSAFADEQTELDLQLTGPWPPYSFAIVNADEPVNAEEPP